MKIAILGGSRLIGSALVPMLAEKIKDLELHIINRGVTPAVWDYEKKWPGRVFRHIADRGSPLNFCDALEKIALKKIDAVIDMSCYTKEELTPAIRAFSKKISQYIFISTCSVYGVLKYLPASEEHPLDTGESNSMYGREKIKCEKELLYSSKNKDFNVTILRPTYIYGPWDYTERLVYFIDRIYKQVPIFFPSGGQDPMFNAIYVKDLARQIAGLLLNEGAYNQIYNAASNDSLYFSEFLKLIGNSLSQEVKLVHVSYDEYKKAAGGLSFPYTRYHTAFDAGKMKALFGEENFPFTPYQQAIDETVSWHIDRADVPSPANYADEKKYFAGNFALKSRPF
jgi:nucleoside-diphosphate-sugar epimerase